MFRLIDIFTYAILLGCEFFALCAMTRGGRGWIAKLLGLALLAAVNVATEGLWQLGTLTPDMWLAIQFTVCWVALSGLTLWLSRDSFGRRVFLALCYGTYAIGYAFCFDVIVYRLYADDKGCRAPAWSILAGLAVVVALTLGFVRWILPRLPRDGRDFRWRESCLVVGVMFAAMYASSLWPVSVVSAPIRDCAPFVLVFVAAWIVFPMVLDRMRDRQRTADIAHSLELMMAEVKERRAAIDLARRLRHDQRHHRAQIAEYMLAGRYDHVFDYLRALDDEAQETPTDKLVWCENETVNAVLSGASRRATAKGVRLEVAANVEKTVAIPDVDLVALVANLIENAIEACGALGDRPLPADGSGALGDRPLPADGCGALGDRPLPADGSGALGDRPLPAGEAAAGRSVPERRVAVSIRQREHGLGITVTNPVPAGFALSESGLPCAEPGVGLESVRCVVERHGGQWSYELAGGTLKCQVILMFSK